MSGLIAPCLWFDGQAEEAANFYVALFPDARIDFISRCGEDQPFPAGTALFVEFTLAGQRFQALNGGPRYRLNEAVSMSVNCDTQAELDRYWDALIAGGGAAQACGWLKDRFGVSWQIVPAAIGRIMASGDEAATARALQAVWGMVKLDIAEIEAAAAG